jgi:hypothetical protein
MESHAIEATPAGLLFADWIAARGCSRSTAYRMRDELGIKPAEKRRRGTAVDVWISAADEALLNAYAEALAQGMSRSDALAAVGRSGALVPASAPGPMVPSESDGPAPLDPMDSDGLAETEADALLHLRRRLAALRDAVDLGAPLSTAEVSLLLGARPGGGEVVRGRLRAVRQRRNVWTVEPD